MTKQIYQVTNYRNNSSFSNPRIDIFVIGNQRHRILFRSTSPLGSVLLHDDHRLLWQNGAARVNIQGLHLYGGPFSVPQSLLSVLGVLPRIALDA